MHLTQIKRGRMLLQSLQTQFPANMALTKQHRTVIRTTASTPSLRASGFPDELRSPLTPTRPVEDTLGPEQPPAEAADSANVRVVVRVRAFVPKEIERKAECLVHMDPATQTTTLSLPSVPGIDIPKDPSTQKKFVFDRSFWSHSRDDDHFSSQKDFYESVGREFLDHNFDGFNTCIFAYGQTGAGKSYTMMGTAQEPGLIPRTCHDLFDRIENDPAPNTTYSVHVSYLEIYNEHVRDLLVTHATPAPYLRIRESPTEGVYVQGLIESQVKNYADVLALLTLGGSNRTTAATRMNDTSSRSHAVFTIQLRQIQHSLTSDSTIERTARIRLVDLAGSERAKLTAATGQRLVEGGKINRSLTTLGRVISALAGPRANRGVVPFRDSILTWLLRGSLIGNSKTAMVACISPVSYEETLSTLRYASQAKQIRLRATANVDAVTSSARDAQIAEMSSTISALQASIAASLSKDQAETTVIPEFQKRVTEMQRLLDETKAVSDAKVNSLMAQLSDLRSNKCQLEDEVDALRRHVRLATLELQNPIVLQQSGSEGDSDEDGPSTIVDDEVSHVYQVVNENTEEWAAEMNELTDAYLQELSVFRRKLGDDHMRFGLKV